MANSKPWSRHGIFYDKYSILKNCMECHVFSHLLWQHWVIKRALSYQTTHCPKAESPWDKPSIHKMQCHCYSQNNPFINLNTHIAIAALTTYFALFWIKWLPGKKREREKTEWFWTNTMSVILIGSLVWNCASLFTNCLYTDCGTLFLLLYVNDIKKTPSSRS